MKIDKRSKKRYYIELNNEYPNYRMIMSKKDKKEELFSEEYFDSLETTLKDKKEMRRFESEETLNTTDR